MPRAINLRGVLLVTLVASLSGCFLDRTGTSTSGRDAMVSVDAGADAQIGPRCGDGLLDPGEACDGADLAMQTCSTRGFTGGNLLCSGDCTFDESLCDTPCGNGAVDPGEQCDGADLSGRTCSALGLMDGTLVCAANCQFDRRGCLGCGNGVVEAPEQCDGSDFGSFSCAGGLACDSNCRIDPTPCEYPSAGDGRDGDLTITERTVFDAANGGASYQVQTIAADRVTVATDATALSAGDEVLLINVQGATGDCGPAGHFELARVARVAGRTVIFNDPITGSYGVGEMNTDLTGHAVILQRIPSFGSVDIMGGSLSPPRFNGRTGGILAFRARELRVASAGVLSVRGRGFRGGAGWSTDFGRDGRQGASICGDPQGESVSPNDGGGGGGVYLRPRGDGCGQGGGGGGYATDGSSLDFPVDCQGVGITTGAANGGGSYGGPELREHLFFGSGGGAGASDDHSSASGRGGRGGGIMLVWARSAVIDGRVQANGAVGIVSDNTLDSGNGGGGAGGSVLLRFAALEGAGRVSAVGARGGASSNGWNSAGGRGGDGRVRMDYFTVDRNRFGTPEATSWLSGRFSPAIGHSELYLD